MTQELESEGTVVSLSRSAKHRFSKKLEKRLRIVEGHGVEGDAHAGSTVKHRSRVAKDPNQPNLRQVHLIASELLEELSRKGFEIEAGDLGENILTVGIDLIALPKGTRLHIGVSVVLRITGLRNPCPQIEAFQEGLLSQMVEKTKDGSLILKTGIMSVVESGGEIIVGEAIQVELPAMPYVALERV